jgi:SpoIID/LytB domain protein
MSQWGAQGAALQGVPFDQILAFYYPGTTLGWVGNPNIRVQLTRHAGDANVFGGIGGETPSVYDQHSGHTEALPAASRYLVTADGAGMHLAYMTPGGWAPLSFNGSGNIVGPIEVVAPSGVSMYDLNLATGRQYRGMMRIIRSGTTGVQAVNVLPMDDYLRGVVPRESPSSWHAEALRSQAVAARSYALSVSRSGGGWDLCDTDLCQVYGGRASIASDGTVTSLEAASTNSAVDATSGIVVAYNNLPAFTQFSSSNGGYSVAGSKPYLVAKPDPYSGSAPGDPVSRWTTQLTVSRVQSECPSGGALHRFEITGRDGRGPYGGRITSLRVDCSTGSRTITNTTALALGMRHRMWIPAAPAGQNPSGQLDAVAAYGLQARVSGWALDPDTPDPIEVHVYVNSGGINLGPAAQSRPDVAAAFPGYGDRHGYDATVPIAPGSNRVCAYGINALAGANTLLGCREVVGSTNPVGRAEVVASGTGPASIQVVGWAFDPETTQPIEVHAYVDGGGHNLGLADDPRPDLAAYFPGVGDHHGFNAVIGAAPGRHQVCLYGINVGSGSHLQMGCTEVIVSGVPIGNLEQAISTGSGVNLTGWALDPDTSGPIEIHVYIDGGGYNLGPTPISRPDVEAAFPGFGDQHGFSWSSPQLPPGPHEVCTYAINVGYGSHGLVGGRCHVITTS